MRYENIPLPEEALQYACRIQEPPSPALLLAEQAFSGGSPTPDTLEDLHSYTYPVAADTNPPPQLKAYTSTVSAAWYKEQREQNYGGLCSPCADNQLTQRNNSLFTPAELATLKNRALFLTEAITEKGAVAKLLEGTASEDLKTIRSNMCIRMIGALTGFAAIPRILASAHFAQRCQSLLEQAPTDDVTVLRQRIDDLRWEWPVRDLYAPFLEMGQHNTGRELANRLQYTKAIAMHFAKVLAPTLQYDPDRLTTPITDVDPSELCSPFLVTSLRDFETALETADDPAARINDFFRGVPMPITAQQKPPRAKNKELPDRIALSIAATRKNTKAQEKPPRAKPPREVSAAPERPKPIPIPTPTPPPVQAKEEDPDRDPITDHPLGNTLHEALKGHTTPIVLAQGSSRMPLLKTKANEHIELGLLATGYQLHRKLTGNDDLPLFRKLAKNPLYATIGDYAGRIIAVRIILEPVTQAHKEGRIVAPGHLDKRHIAAYIAVETRSSGKPDSKHNILPHIISHALELGRATISFTRQPRFGEAKSAQIVEQFELPEHGRRDG